MITFNSRQFCQINIVKRALPDRFLFAFLTGSSFTQELRIKVWAALLWRLGNPSEWFPPGIVGGLLDLPLNADTLNGTKAQVYS